jgi:hypothetical protein
MLGFAPSFPCACTSAGRIVNAIKDAITRENKILLVFIFVILINN